MYSETSSCADPDFFPRAGARDYCVGLGGDISGYLVVKMH